MNVKLIFGGSIVLILLGAWMWLWLSAAGPSPGGRERTSEPERPEVATVGEIQRVAVDATVPAASPEPATAGPRSFEEVYIDIVTCLRSGQLRALQARDQQPTVDTGEEARLNALMKEMVTQVPDSGGCAVRKVASLTGDWSGSGVSTEVFACRTIVDLQLQVRTRNTEALGDPAELVQLLLEHMAFNEELGRFAHALLNRKPYLGWDNEPTLRAMIQSAVGDIAYLEPLARDLLLTVYLNVDGDNGDLLALAEGGEGEEAQVAALQRLLLSPRYRSLALAKLIDRHDGPLMDRAAIFAVANLEPDDALEVLIALKSTPEGEARPFGAYLKMADRAPTALAASYEAALASNTLPAHRMNAMVHLARLDGEHGRQLAKTGFQSDPSPRVKGVALVALGTRLETAEFEPLFQVAIGDETFRNSHFGWSDLVSALSNHARRKGGADVNFLDRATKALEALLPGDKEDLRGRVGELRRQYVPQ